VDKLALRGMSVQNTHTQGSGVLGLPWCWSWAN